MNENCLDCLYANYTELTMLMMEYDNDARKCEHPNSPYHDEYVNEHMTCRFFTNEIEYFRNKDLREKIEKIKTKKS